MSRHISFGMNSRQRRSRSPSIYDQHRHAKRGRSRSPHLRHHRHRSTSAVEVSLPFRQRKLHRSDFTRYYNLFAEYLELQKGLDIADLAEGEIKGRWKSFLGKWNRGQLAEGWYDAETKSRIDERRNMPPPKDFIAPPDATVPPKIESPVRYGGQDDRATDEDVDDDYGPPPPPASSRLSGPSVPSFQDLQQRNDLIEEHRASHRADMRFERKLDRNLQKERLDELAPRADPGSREKKLEKKREAAVANRGFRDAKSPGAAEVDEGDLMGTGGADSYKAKLKARDKVKNEREIRKEESLRARAAEREERLAEHRRKEETTMEKLKAIAKQRFG